jgi:hypothetical protein
MRDDRDRDVAEEKDEAMEALGPGSQSESEVENDDTDLLLERRSTPELRRWLRERYRLVTGG